MQTALNRLVRHYYHALSGWLAEPEVVADEIEGYRDRLAELGLTSAHAAGHLAEALYPADATADAIARLGGGMAAQALAANGATLPILAPNSD